MLWLDEKLGCGIAGCGGETQREFQGDMDLNKFDPSSIQGPVAAQLVNGGGGGSRTIHDIENRRVTDCGGGKRTKMPTMPNRLYVYCTGEAHSPPEILAVEDSSGLANTP